MTKKLKAAVLSAGAWSQSAHLPALLGEAQPLVAAALFSAGHGTAAADLMIVVGIVEQGSLQASSTVYSRPNRPEKD